MRRWDEFEAYLFDIDGTLLRCRDAVHYFAFCDALTSVAGEPLNLDGVVAHGNTDIGILRDAFAARGIPEERWRPRLPELVSGMCAQVAAQEEQVCAEVIDGVRETLAHLRARGAVLGVGTGNLAAIGWLKLRRAGLESQFAFGAFSDACEYRRDVMRAGIAEARRRTHADAAICVVGDTPADVRAARENGVDAIAVATGVYTLQELAAEAPAFCVPSLRELRGSSERPR